MPFICTCPGQTICGTLKIRPLFQHIKPMIINLPFGVLLNTLFIALLFITIITVSCCDCISNHNNMQSIYLHVSWANHTNIKSGRSCRICTAVYFKRPTTCLLHLCLLHMLITRMALHPKRGMGVGTDCSKFNHNVYTFTIHLKQWEWVKRLFNECLVLN